MGTTTSAPRLLAEIAAIVCLAGVSQGAGAAPPAGQPRLELLSPERGARWSAGSTHTITWRPSASGATARVEFSLDKGKTWTPCAGTPAAGLAAGAGAAVTDRLLWTVPAKPGARCRVRVIETGGSAMENTGRSEVTIAPSQEASYEWKCVTEKAAFAGRDGAGALVFQGKMWLLGGWNPGDKEHFPRICNSEVWSSRDGATWTLENPQAPWEGRHTAGCVVHAGRMWIVGGDCNQHHYQNDVWSSADGVRWDRVTDSVPWTNRVLHHTVAFAGRIWVLGGQSLPQFAPAPEAFYNDVWCSEDGARWTRVTAAAPWEPRGEIGGGVVFRNRIWILGGGTYDTPGRPQRAFYNDVWSSADGVRWERHLEHAPWMPRQYHEVAVFDDRMWVMEGWNQANRNDVWYSADGVNWYEVPNTPWVPRHAASVFVHDNALWMVAGNNMFPDVWRLRRVE